MLPEDVTDLVPDVLRHRLVLTYEALAEGMTPTMLIQQIMQHVPRARQAAGSAMSESPHKPEQRPARGSSGR